MDVMRYIWIAAIVLLAILEGATAQLVCIWFVIGGIAALVTSIFTDVIWIQLTVFVVVSILSLLITRPLVKKAMSFQKEDTNAGRIVGQKGIVTEAVENDQGKGQVNVSGSIWTARSMDQTVIPKGASVLVDAIEGVKLIVHPIEEKE